ncbi:zinc ribbon domain-containing protein [Lentilactobacillus kisonensis]|uniref:Zinc-ribbon domain-containing protein n=1 Tax=Lentilactobacillus kisonensis F0435 TaxID=797516 RepID=H1LGV8_9LACO|nr:zinc ribbon domain-containing protein [Lentilactobacillus kisonensis]EHO50738.1 hypothetical protein HMPREF9104_01837 [Lentilactobacillus kisonensis F0435]
MEKQKYCVHCGQQIAFSAKYCPNCGYEQPQFKARAESNPNVEAPLEQKSGEQALGDQETGEPVQADQPKENIPPQSVQQPNVANSNQIDPKDFGNCLNLDNLNAYRRQLGYPRTDNICVYGYFFSTGAIVLLGPIGALTSKYYMISFEKDGILFLGIGMTQHFNGQNSFVNFSDISSIKFTNVGMNYHLDVKSPKGEIKAKIGKLILGHSWQGENGKKLYEMYGQK